MKTWKAYKFRRPLNSGTGYRPRPVFIWAEYTSFRAAPIVSANGGYRKAGFKRKQQNQLAVGLCLKAEMLMVLLKAEFKLSPDTERAAFKKMHINTVENVGMM